MAKKDFKIGQNGHSLQSLNEKLNAINQQSVAKIDSNLPMDYELIDYNLIDCNPENDFPINNIELTSKTIEQFGLLHNLVLQKNKNNRYTIISGERRYWAIGKIREEYKKTNQPIPDKYQKIVSKIVDVDNLEQKIMLEIANLDVRELSPELKRKKIQNLSLMLQEKNKMAQNREDKINIAKMIGEMLKINRRQVYKYQKISRNLIPELIECLDKEQIIIDDAEKMASYPIELQYQIWDMLMNKETVTLELLTPNIARQIKILKNIVNQKLQIKDELNAELNQVLESELTEEEKILIRDDKEEAEKSLEKKISKLTKIVGQLEKEIEENGKNQKIDGEKIVKNINSIYRTVNKKIDQIDEQLINTDSLEKDKKKKLVQEVDKMIQKLKEQKKILNQ